MAKNTKKNGKNGGECCEVKEKCKVVRIPPLVDREECEVERVCTTKKPKKKGC